MIFDFFYSYRLKRAQAYVQRDLDNFNPAGANALEDFGCEVQAGRRGCYRSSSLGVDGLVPITVCHPVIFAMNVRRKRDVSNALDAGKKIVDRGESDAPLAKTPAGYDLGVQFGWGVGWRTRWSVKVEFFPDADLPPGPYQALPLNRIISHLACQQYFDPPAEKISCRRITRAHGLGAPPAPVAVEPGPEHPSIVQDQEIVRPQQVGEFAKTPILPTLRPIPARPPQVQHARSSAVRQWLLRNAIRRQIIMEVRD